MNINLIYSKPSINKFVFDNDDYNDDYYNIINNIGKLPYRQPSNNLLIISPPIQPQSIPQLKPQPQPQILKIIEKYRIAYDNDIGMYMMNLFIGSKNNKQKVSVIIDTQQIDILIPTPCCIGKGCLSNPSHGLYYFDKSKTCEIKLPNESSEKCKDHDCYTISTLQDPVDRRLLDNRGSTPIPVHPSRQLLLDNRGIIEKVDATDYVSFSKDDNGEMAELILILKFDGINIDTYIPPTLGIGIGNILDKKNILLDFVNNYISFSNTNFIPKYTFVKSNETFGEYSFIANTINVGKHINIGKIPVSASFDTGINTIQFPNKIYNAIIAILQKSSGIPVANNFWKGVQININNLGSLNDLKLPDITLTISTTTEPYTWTLTKKEYVSNKGGNGILEFRIERSNDNLIHMGNIAMKGKKFLLEKNIHII